MSDQIKFNQPSTTPIPYNDAEPPPVLPVHNLRRKSSYFRRSSLARGGGGGANEETRLLHDGEVFDPTLLKKLGTFDGVFVPTALNVLSILMFLRFGFIIGQMGVLGTFLLLFMSYGIDLLTTLSISAIATNGTVRGGGAYYMISRSLGPEFGGSIGLIFYIGQVLNSALNVVGFIEPLLANLGREDGSILKVFPQGYWWQLMYSSLLLFSCICIALVGAHMVSKAGFFLFVLLIASTISIPISTLFVKPFEVERYGLLYTGISWATLKGNLMPRFTEGAAGSLLKGKETFNDVFGIFFPATAGIFAGASMSGDLRKPSKSIPKGTLWGLLLTFVFYFSVILSLGSSVPRNLLHNDVQIIQTISMSPTLILIGEISTCLFSVIMGIVGASNVLGAIAKDSIFPGLGSFSNSSINAILLTWLLTQLCLFVNMNQIATFITMAFLMTFIVTNLACFLLKIASAPNFRPSFKYFDWYTALFGAVSAVIAMFIVDGFSATMVVIFLIGLFVFIHYVCPPKPWGDVSQSLIYHQVRKYLLRLRQDNVKYWRPQILLLVDSPRSSWNLIQFCNNLKKGGLYILGHVIVTESFQNNFTEFKTQQNAWVKLRDFSKVKAFVQIGLGPTLPWGVRNVIMGSGLGNMKPNITVLGFFDTDKRGDNMNENENDNINSGSNINLNNNVGFDPIRPSTSRVSTQQKLHQLPTDECRNEQKVSIQNWVSVVEDLILMKANVAVAKGFEHLEFPEPNIKKMPYSKRKFIDLYPIQMSAEVFDSNGERSAMTINFDTYTLILQLGAILSTVPTWKKTHRLRIVVFVEDKDDIENERQRIESLIGVLRIKAIILVLCLKDFPTYNTIVKGSTEDLANVDRVLKNDEWWKELKLARLNELQECTSNANFNIHGGGNGGGLNGNVPTLTVVPPTNINNLTDKKYDLPKLQKMGLAVSMTTNKLYGNEISMAFESDSEPDEDDYYESFSSEADLLLSQNSENFDKTKSDRKFLNSSTSSIKQSTNALLNPFNLEVAGYSSYYSTAQTPHTPLSPGKVPLKQPSILALNKAIQKNSRPNFSSEKVPLSKVIDDATGDEPSIMLLPDADPQNSLSRKKKHERKVSEQIKKEIASPTLEFISEPQEDGFTKCQQDAASPQPECATKPIQGYFDNLNLDQDQNESEGEFLDINEISFNDLPAKGQHLILNSVMKTVSNDVAVIFTTLPAPFMGTHRNEEDCVEYLENLQVWLRDLPPILLINSQSMTVTTAL